MKILMGEALYYNSIIHVGSHHYADQFVADGHEVFWLGGSLHLGNLLRARRGNANDRELSQLWREGPVQVRDRFQTYHPLTLLPYRNHPLLGKRSVLERTLLFTAPSVRSVLAKAGFSQPDLLWLSQSHSSLSILKAVPRIKTAYRMSDDYNHFDSVPESMKQAEIEIIQTAEVVFCTARKILDYARQFRAEGVHYLPNGVDYDHFQVGDCPEPDDVQALPRPRILYVGSLSHWFDTELLAYAARALPQCSFVVIGKPNTDLSALQGIANLHLLGSRPYPAIPPYLRHAEVGVIPFQRNPLTDATNPVKLFEYFAAGLPVVSVRLHEMEQLNSPAYLTETKDEFVQAICAAQEGGRDRPEFDAFARANSWQGRYQRIKEVCRL